MKILNILALCFSIFLFSCAPKPLDDYEYGSLVNTGVGSTTITKEKKWNKLILP